MKRNSISLGRLIGGVAILTLFLLYVSGNMAWAENLSLEARMESSSFLEDQPINVLICLTNRDRVSIGDIARPKPGSDYLELKLVDLQSGRELPWTGLRYHSTFGSEGINLEPGGSICEGIDLAVWFGSRYPEGYPLARVFHRKALPAGSYQLYAAAWVHTGYRGDATRTHVQAPPVRFEILPLATETDEASLVSDFLTDLAGAHDSEEHCRRWLPRFYGSRYFHLIYRNSGVQALDSPIGPVIANLRQVGASEESEALLVAYRCKLQSALRTQGIESFLEDLRHRVSGRRSEIVVRDWQRRWSQGKYNRAH